MHDYKKMRAELIGKGFSESDAFKIVRLIETDDIVTELLFAQECKNKAREEHYNNELDKMHARLMDKHRLDWVSALRGFAIPMAEEKKQRQLLSEKGFREKPNVFLAAVLKYFCKFEDWQIVLITGVMGLPSVPEPDPLDELGLGLK